MSASKMSRILDSSRKTKYGEEFLISQAKSLISFTKGSVLKEGGFGYLDSFGNVDRNKPRELYIQCRMIQVLGLAQLFEITNSENLIDHGVDAILDNFQDSVYGGFYNAIDLEGKPTKDSKLAYDHMFVLLAACTAKVAGSRRADELLSIIDQVIDQFYWDNEHQMMNNSWDIEFKNLDTYRGINANMHAVEALCANGQEPAQILVDGNHLPRWRWPRGSAGRCWTRKRAACSRRCRPWVPAGARRACWASALAARLRRPCCWPRKA